MNNQTQNQLKFDLNTVKGIADQLIADLQPFCERIVIAGSVRRMKPRPKDLELVCIPKKVKQLGMFGSEQDLHPVLGFVKEVEKYEAVKGLPEGRYTQRILPSGLKLDLFMVSYDNWGYQLAIRTGSSNFSHGLAKRWVSLGYKGVDGYLTMNGKIIPVNEEHELFNRLGLSWIEPEKRI